MNDVTLDSLVAVGGALGHPARLRILALLRDGDLYVCQIRSILGLATSTVSVHLAILRRSGLLAEQKQGRFVQYGLTDDEPLGSVVREILHLVKDDIQVVDDARLLEAVRRVPLDRLCRAGVDLTAMGIEGRGGRRRRPAPPQGRRPAPATGPHNR
jgi:ArsR family transcriptional regulator, arsenate/arsenite/antimonite-responsive transcriptional repressor